LRATPELEAGHKFFREKIEPVLRAECYECHSAEAKKLRGGLRLDLKAGVLAGGNTGPALVAGDAKSLLLQALRHEDADLKMPPEKPKLPANVIADFERWIQIGAPDPRTDGEVAKAPNPATDPKLARGYWAFQPVRATVPPAVKNSAWPAGAIDRFVLARLESAQLAPALAATKAELLRRVTFDLTGLPPTPEESAAFLADDSADAYARVVDRLLASPAYGEHFARDWLDVVRFAETEGFEYDRHMPGAWRFRDYVIDSLNRDKPFDRFITEQIAGDEIAPDDHELATAAGFHRFGAVRRNAGNQTVAVSRNEILIERTDIIGSAILGLTVGCARCHDHKLDPILQKDYYRLQAYFAATQEHSVLLMSPAEREPFEAKWKPLNAQLDELRALLENLGGADRQTVTRQIRDLEAKLPPAPPSILTTRNEPDKRTPIHVLKRGDWDSKGEPVAPRPPTVLVSDNLAELPADTLAPRTALARWLTDPAHPLTARVAVNRIWQHHFGTGLVKTPNDFGQNGDRPSHPELLDWLAREFVAGGWRAKPLHRAIVLSSAYRQSSRAQSATAAAAAMRVDPENRLLWHMRPRRLGAEEIRDAMLAVSGQLNAKRGGESIMVPVDEEQVKLLYKPSQWEVAKDASEHRRRSIYLIAKRNLRLPFMETFDQPDLLGSCGRREASTHAPQALELMNGKLANELSAAFAARLTREAGPDAAPAQIVDRAYWLVANRAPTDAEKKLGVDFLRGGAPTKEFALAMLNLNAFLYVP
ncbi:MAG: hypothetical protein RLZZ15_112, partial [Verrucomicrobiota bacterium]